MSLRIKIAGAALALVLALFTVFGVGWKVSQPSVEPNVAQAPVAALATETAEENSQGYLYGRITTQLGVTYEGRLRWGGGEEAFWGDYFNGIKGENVWIEHVPEEQLPKESRSFKIFGLELAGDATRRS